ncbi:MAG: hypothetical protein K9J79_10555 [Desulfobacteraceae bacterium]|nr:hypothetical protein [Desulfobacteraceae bacterium]
MPPAPLFPSPYFARIGPSVRKGEINNYGNVIFDVALFYAKRSEGRSGILAANCIEPKRYVLATVHRAENTDDPLRLRASWKAWTRQQSKCR